MVLALRVLDVHVQQVDPLRVEYITEAMGWALSDLLFHHLDALTPAVYDLRDDDYGSGYYHDLVRFEIQGNEAVPVVVSVMEAAETFFREACDTAEPRYESHEWLDLESGIELRRTAVDADFEDALLQGISSRKSAEKPKPARAQPNSLHHVLLCTDPILRISHGKVINLSRLAALQVAASEQRAHTLMEDEGRDEWEVDWGPDYDQRLATMKSNPTHMAITWLFLVDAGTQVFAVTPVPSAELTIDTLLQFMDAAWRGEHGLLRGPPVAVSLPVAYATTERARSHLAQCLAQRGVALHKPASGFATPLHMARLWCGDTRDMQSADREARPPC